MWRTVGEKPQRMREQLKATQFRTPDQRKDHSHSYCFCTTLQMFRFNLVTKIASILGYVIHKKSKFPPLRLSLGDVFGQEDEFPFKILLTTPSETIRRSQMECHILSQTGGYKWWRKWCFFESTQFLNKAKSTLKPKTWEPTCLSKSAVRLEVAVMFS